MSYLLDTNVLSELTKPVPERALLDWFASQQKDDLWVSVITFGEIERGILLLNEGRRKKNLLAWLERVRAEFEDRTLPVDAPVMRTWAKMYSKPAYKGTMRDALDSLLAATSNHHGLSITTRNRSDFPKDISTVNPWSDGGKG